MMSPILDPKSIESCSVSMNSPKKKMESDAGSIRHFPAFHYFLGEIQRLPTYQYISYVQ